MKKIEYFTGYQKQPNKKTLTFNPINKRDNYFYFFYSEVFKSVQNEQSSKVK